MNASYNSLLLRPPFLQVTTGLRNWACTYLTKRFPLNWYNSGTHHRRLIGHWHIKRWIVRDDWEIQLWEGLLVSSASDYLFFIGLRTTIFACFYTVFSFSLHVVLTYHHFLLHISHPFRQRNSPSNFRFSYPFTTIPIYISSSSACILLLHVSLLHDLGLEVDIFSLFLFRWEITDIWVDQGYLDWRNT